MLPRPMRQTALSKRRRNRLERVQAWLQPTRSADLSDGPSVTWPSVSSPARPHEWRREVASIQDWFTTLGLLLPWLVYDEFESLKRRIDA